MKEWVYNRFMAWFWASLVTGLVLVTLYVSAGRYFSSSISLFRNDILTVLNERLELQVGFGEIAGSWYWFSPVVVLNDISLGKLSSAEPDIVIDRLEMDMDVWATLLSRSLQFRQLRGSGVTLGLEQTEQGNWNLIGFSTDSDSDLSLTPLLQSIFNIQRLTLSGVVAEIAVWQKPSRSVALDARLYREGDFHRIELDIDSKLFASKISVVGEGHGDPLDPTVMEGQLYISLASAAPGDLPHLSQWLGLDFLRGNLEGEFWVNWHGGAGEAVALVDASDLEFKRVGASQAMGPIDSVTLELASAYIDSSWYVQLSDGEVLWNEQRATLPKLIAEYESQQLDVLMHDFSLTDFSKTMAESKWLTEQQKQLLATLNPGGKLTRAQISLPLGEQLATGWQLQANFADFSLESWKGAPGINNGAGYISLDSSGGTVDIDAENFSMYFPTVYKQALSYEQFQVQLNWTMASDGVVVRSGPLQASGPEGLISGLFSLDIPLAERKLVDDPEMELMIGLKNSQPKYRSKYLPYTLPENLLSWLASSIGDGQVREGGFIYRGSLRREQRDYRTVQLFFDVDDVELKYDKNWPALSSIEGLVLIDDKDVDVIASDAQIYSSQLQNIRIAVWPGSDQGLILSAAATMSGSAADGLQLVHESPLRANVGEVFVDWELPGQLQTTLDLQMNLSGKSRPTVKVSTLWQEVDIDMKPFGLKAEAVSGVLNYSTKNGFSSEGIGGHLWGEPLSIKVSQALKNAKGMANVGSDQQTLLIDFQTRMDMTPLRQWLNLGLLDFASGSTDLKGQIVVPTAGTAQLALESTLEGVALDLPPPYKLSADAIAGLTVNLPLSTGQQRLDLVVENRLKVYVALQGKQFVGGGVELGLGGRVSERETTEGIFLMGGHVAYLKWQDWKQFLDRYLVESGEASTGPMIDMVVEGLRVDELFIDGQKLSDITVGMRQDSDRVHLTMANDWLDGAMEINELANSWTVDFSRLDISGLLDNSEIDLDSQVSDNEALPSIAVDIAQLDIAGESWGNIAMNVNSIAGGIEVSNIRGELRNLKIGTETGATLSWFTNSDEYSRFDGDVQFDDLGDVLESWHYQRVAETRDSGSAALTLQWPGGPEDFSFQHSTGEVKFETGKGRFLTPGSPTTGTLRVVGILNFAEFLKRLSLDLSHIFKSGIAFEKIDGKLLFAEKNMTIHNFDVQGRSSHFQIAGNVDMATDTIDAQLVATLPISSNLPWMAALAGGLPAAAGIYVVSKVFENQLERVSSAAYSIKGPTAGPEVKLERIFDHKQAQKKAKNPPEKPSTESEALTSEKNS